MTRRELHHALAVTPPGVEELSAGELRALGVRVRRAFRGGVEFSANDRELYAANLWCRTVTRVLVRVARFVAPGFAELERELAAVPWERWVPTGATPTVRVSSTSSRLYHTDAVAERVAAAAGTGVVGPDAPAGPLVVVRLVHDRVIVSVDSSGAPLHQRGWHLERGAAPLRETLAAATLLASGWRPGAPLVDPYCGSGTIPLEAALMAAGRPPGAGRRFGFEDWPSFAPGTWAAVKAAPAPVPAGDGAPVQGSDRDASAVAAARANAARAGVGGGVRFSVAAVAQSAPVGNGPGWLVSNPPYGKRSSAADVRSVYAQLGAVARDRFDGWTVALLVADARAARAAGLPFTERLRTVNGGIPAHVLVAPIRSRDGPHRHRGREGHRGPAD
jgi:putative N6-adenine-specific DNA methylase